MDLPVSLSAMQSPNVAQDPDTTSPRGSGDATPADGSADGNTVGLAGSRGEEDGGGKPKRAGMMIDGPGSKGNGGKSQFMLRDIIDRVMSKDLVSVDTARLTLALDTMHHTLDRHEEHILHPTWLPDIMKQVKEVGQLKSDMRLVQASIDDLKKGHVSATLAGEDSPGGRYAATPGASPVPGGAPAPLVVDASGSTSGAGGGPAAATSGAGGGAPRRLFRRASSAGVGSSALRVVMTELDGLREEVRKMRENADYEHMKLEVDTKLAEFTMSTNRLSKTISGMASHDELEHAQEDLETKFQEALQSIKQDNQRERKKLDQSVSVDLRKMEHWVQDLSKKLLASSDEDETQAPRFASRVELRSTEKHVKSRLDMLDERTGYAEDQISRFSSLSDQLIFQKINAAMRSRQSRTLKSALLYWRDTVADQIAEEDERERKRRLLAKVFGHRVPTLLCGVAVQSWKDHSRQHARRQEQVQVAVHTCRKMMDKWNTETRHKLFRRWKRLHLMDKLREATQEAHAEVDAINSRIELHGSAAMIEEGGAASGESELGPPVPVEYDHVADAERLKVVLNAAERKDDSMLLAVMVGRELCGLRHQVKTEVSQGLGNQLDDLIKWKEENPSGQELEKRMLEADERARRELQNTRQFCQQNLQDMWKEQTNLNRKLDGFRSTISDVQSTMLDIKTLIANTDAENKRLHSVQGDLLQRASHAEDQLALLNRFEKQTREAVSQLDSRATDVEERMTQCQERVDDTSTFFEGQVKGLKKRVGKNEENIASLDQEVADNRALIQSVNDKLAAAIEGLAKRLQNRGLKMPDMTRMVQACSALETVSHDRKLTPPFPDELNKEIATFAHSMAEYIATRADMDVLVQLVSGLHGPGNDQTPLHADNQVSDRRENITADFDVKFQQAVAALHPQAGLFRTEARTKFRRKMLEAIDVALSKFDQILVAGSSSFGRIKPNVPTCVACDRPLTTKQRHQPLQYVERVLAKQQDALHHQQGQGAGQQQQQQQLQGPRTLESLKQLRQSQSHPNLPPQQQPQAPLSPTLKPPQPVQQHPHIEVEVPPRPAVDVPSTSDGVVGGRTGGHYPGSSEAAREQFARAGTPENSPFVYRGGFRMPKHSSTEELADLLAYTAHAGSVPVDPATLDEENRRRALDSDAVAGGEAAANQQEESFGDLRTRRLQNSNVTVHQGRIRPRSAVV